MNLKTTFVAIILLALSVTASVTITKNTTRDLSFTFEIGSYNISSYKIGGKTYSRLTFKQSNCEINTSERISLPALSVYAGVPQTGSVSALLNSHSVKRIVLDHPLPVDESKDPFNSTPEFKNPWISDIKYVHFRNLRTAHVYLKPFLYDAKSKTLTVLLKGSCTIKFPPNRQKHVSIPNLRGDYYSSIKDMVLNFDIAKKWMKSKSKPLSRQQLAPLLPSDETLIKFKIGDGYSGYNEATTKENRIIKITHDDMLTYFGASANINAIMLYGAQKNDIDSTVPEITTISDGVREIPLLRVDHNKNGILDTNDYLLAYVTGLSDWYFDTLSQDYEFNFNHYGDYRYYWIRNGVNGKSIKQFSCSGTPMDTITVFENRERYKKSRELMYDGMSHPYGGKEWIYKRLKGNFNKYEYEDPSIVNYADTTLPGAARLVTGRSSSSTVASMHWGDSLIGNTTNKWLPFFNFQKNRYKVILESSFQFVEIKDIDIRCWQPLSMLKDSSTDSSTMITKFSYFDFLRVYSPVDTTADSIMFDTVIIDSFETIITKLIYFPQIVHYFLSNIPPEKTYIFRLSSNESKMHLIDTISIGGTYSWIDTAQTGVQYIIVTDSALSSMPSSESRYSGTNDEFNIRSPRQGLQSCDYLVITEKTFEKEALKLVEHKKNRHKFSNPKLILMSDIYREFSGGNHDPGAIRNFLFYAHNAPNWTIAPDYVVLLGNGHYIYKGYGKTNEVNFIPPAIYDFKAIEDFFVCIIPGEQILSSEVAPDLFLGRINCKTPTEADNAISKIVEMESPGIGDFGAWRNRLLLVSDDDMQGDGIDVLKHHSGNEDIETNALEQRPDMEMRKVYLFEYEWNEVNKKPEASNAIFNEVNNVGVSCINYFGHGSENAWADEAILIREQLANFHNKGRYPLVCSFSCSVGHFDSPDATSLSGDLVILPNAGSIGCISSVRTAYATQNTNMSKAFFKILYEKGTDYSPGQAYGMTKAFSKNINLKHYAYMGDPSINFFTVTDSIEMNIFSEDGKILIDTISALTKIKVKGRILRNNTTNTSFGTSEKTAYISIGLYNPKQDSVVRKDGGTFSKPVYSLPGKPVFVGVTEVNQGVFEQNIIIPRRVSFGKPGVALKVYAWNDESFAVGSNSNYIFYGSDTSVTSNDEGPKIMIRPIYDNDTMWNSSIGFTDKISSFLPIKFEIGLYDENGIDVAGSGADEGLNIEVPGSKIVKKNINHKFIFEGGEYTRGNASQVFEPEHGFSEGTYDMIITAQDLLGNLSKQTFTVEVLSEENFKMGRVFNFPNPVRMGSSTKIYFYHPNTSEQKYGKVTATIKIYTLNGKLIRIYKNARNGQVWDLKDQRGNNVTPNIYLYRVFVRMPDPSFVNSENVIESAIKKIVVHPPH